MPRISLFFGIVIYMYYNDVGQHRAAHVHAEHGDEAATFALVDGAGLDGWMSRKHVRRVQEWISERRAELDANWQRALRGEELLWVDPLS